MNAKITLTIAELTAAQMGKTITLNTGETLCAVPALGGKWKYLLSWGGVVGLIRYAGPGLNAALWAINASQEEYDEE